MTKLTFPQRSSDSYLNLSLMINDFIGQDLVTWNNRLHLSDYKRSVLLQTPVLESVSSDLLAPDFYQTLNAEKGRVWAFGHSAVIQGLNDNVMLSGYFDVLMRCPDAVQQSESYFQFYRACSDALLNNRALSDGVFIDWLIQPADIESETEGQVLSGYVMRCCVESLEYSSHQLVVERMRGVTGLIANINFACGAPIIAR